MWVSKDPNENDQSCLLGWKRFIPRVENMRLCWSPVQVLPPEVLERFQKIYEKLFGKNVSL